MYAKKSLGQHFLTAHSYVRQIADAAQLKEGEVVLEIGPGKGVLTEELLARGATVIAIEKDRELIPYLREEFSEELENGRLTLIEGDALEADPKKLGLAEGAYKVVANIPYYITGALFEKFLGNAPRPSTLVFLIQKEVAERIARSKKESLLSLSVKAYGTPTYIKTVPAGAFSPAPSVDSAILAVHNVSAGNFKNPKQEKRFFEILHAGFAHKRKLLVRNLEPVLGKEGAMQALRAAGIDEKARAEDLPPKAWLDLSY